jgi:hypothetical protein
MTSFSARAKAEERKGDFSTKSLRVATERASAVLGFGGGGGASWCCRWWYEEVEEDESPFARAALCRAVSVFGPA